MNPITNLDTCQARFDGMMPLESNIDIALDDLQDAIQSDTRLYDACSKVEQSLHMTLEPDSVETRVDCGEVLVSGSLGFELGAENVASYRGQLAQALRELAKKLDH